MLSETECCGNVFKTGRPVLCVGNYGFLQTCERPHVKRLDYKSVRPPLIKGVLAGADPLATFLGKPTNNADWIYTYDDENRLIAWSQGAPTAGALGSGFAYDGLGRLRARSEYQGDGSGWVLQSVVNYIYDGKRVIQERDGDNNPVNSYTRGSDLSGSLEGAGGIGGLLARSVASDCTSNLLTVCITNDSAIDWVFWIYGEDGTNVDAATISVGTSACFTFNAMGGAPYTIFGTDTRYHALQILEVFNATLDYHQMDVGPDPEEYTSSDTGAVLKCWQPRDDFYFADGNGNITALVDTNQTLSASYRYDPFGNTISQSGIVADANTYRFSSKEFHANSGLYYYLYRFYDPGLQRWISSDPISDLGFNGAFHPRLGTLSEAPSDFVYVRNSPLGHYDALGLTGCAREKPCCVMNYRATAATPWGVFNGGCIYTVTLKYALPHNPNSCCPNTSNWGKAAFNVYIRSPCGFVPADIFINMWKKTDPSDGGWSKL
jgi:RHS repeat-associated protein